MASSDIKLTPESSIQPCAAEASSMHIYLPADWRADDQPRTEEEWCPVCEWDGSWQNLLHRPQEPEEQRGNNEQNKSYSTPSLDASAGRGNLCCAVLLAYSRAGWSDNILVLLSKSLTTTTSPLSISRASFGVGLLGRSRPVRRLFALEEAGADEALPPGMQSLPEDLYHSVEEASGMCSRDSSMAWAKKRIDECHEHHPKCGSSYVDFLPTRLIHVPADPKTHGICLRLGDSVPPDTIYTALSHCWGPEESWPECQTTADNYEQQLLGIPWANVPRTFADAIIITQQLGIEYFWIDSLCVIQRDEADWKLQSVTMHQVYSNAHVTLAAVDSPDSRAGFWLGPSLYWKMPEPLLTFEWRGREYPLFLFSEPANPTFGVVHGACYELWDRPPLLTRAWAFQERMVSPRTLFFSRGSLVWDCSTKGEAQPDLFSELLGVASSPFRGPKQHFAAHSTTAAPASSFSVWHQIVSQYTMLRLSVPTDKLPGVAAIAQRISASRPRDEYLCGLWRSSLAHDLLWERKYQPQYHHHYIAAANEHAEVSGNDGEPEESQSVRLYTGPSWSWVSSSAAVTYPLESEDIATLKLEVTGTCINLRDGNPFGRVSPGSHLVIRTQTLACSWNPAPANCAIADRYWLQVLGSQSQAVRHVCFKLDNQRWSNWDKDAVTDAVIALIGLTENGHTRALVLHRFPNARSYRRIGVLLSPKDFMFDATCAWLAEAFEEGGLTQTIALE